MKSGVIWVLPMSKTIRSGSRRMLREGRERYALYSTNRRVSFPSRTSLTK